MCGCCFFILFLYSGFYRFRVSISCSRFYRFRLFVFRFYRFRLFVFRVLQIPAFRVSGFTDSGFSCSGFYRFRLFVFRVLLIPAFHVPGFLVPCSVPRSVSRFPVPCFTDSHFITTANIRLLYGKSMWNKIAFGTN